MVDNPEESTKKKNKGATIFSAFGRVVEYKLKLQKNQHIPILAMKKQK